MAMSITRGRPLVTPVIHVTSPRQALENVSIAADVGADGVWLISHQGDDDALVPLADTVVAHHPGLMVGVNFLGSTSGQAVKTIAASGSPAITGYWSDNAGIIDDEVEMAEADAAERRTSGWRGTYFGGVAFKYQRTPTDLEQTCRTATRFVDVVCTSGPGTGAAADVDKIAQIRDAIGDHPLAIASGITPDNVADYLDLVDVFMVATGISRSFDQLDTALTSELVRHVQDYRESHVSANRELSP